MDARTVDEAAIRLRELRQDEWAELGLAAVALVLAVLAALAFPPLAVPLFAGGVVVGALGVRALWRRWDLVDRLASERDAYAIAEVLEYALRESRMERREVRARRVRDHAERCAGRPGTHCAGLAAELEALARELDDQELDLDPASAVACARLLDELVANALVGVESAPAVVRSRVRRIRSGFRPRACA